MSVYWYDRKTDDLRRSLETPGQSSNGHAIGSTRRDYFPVNADDGTKIHVPLRYLAETAQIEITGSCACTIKGNSYFIVLIVNGAKIPESVTNKVKSTVGHVVEKGIDRVADSKESAIRGRVQPVVQQMVSEAKGLSLSQSAKNSLTKAGTKAGTFVVKAGAAEAVSAVVGGVGWVGLALEADSAGHEESRVGKSENGCQVDYHLTGVKPTPALKDG